MLKVGDRVVMRVPTTVYANTNNNPHNREGTVTAVSANPIGGYRNYDVHWDNGYSNTTYRWGRDIMRAPADSTIMLCSTSYQSCDALNEGDKEIIKNKLNLLETALSN